MLTGPAGSGKTTLAQELARRMNWVAISEDDYWAHNGWGADLRTREQESAVQQQILTEVVAVCRSGKGVVLEFILYAEPPNPLSVYEEALTREGVDVRVVALRPSVTEILRRMAVRRRPEDLGRLDERRVEAAKQLRILDAASFRSGAIDATGLSVEQTAQICLEMLGDWWSTSTAG